MRRISSHLWLTPSGELAPGRVVTVDERGEVISVSQTAHLDGEAGVEFYPGILMPGMLNAHCHLELSHLRGMIPSGEGFEGFVEAMKKAPRGGGIEGAKFWDSKMWADGVSEVWDICNGESTFELKAESPVRYLSFREIFGFGATVPAGANNLTPHSLYSLDKATFEAVVSAENKSPSALRPLSIHFMESEYEVDDPAVRLVEQVPADRPVVLVHNCCVTQRDIDILMGHFTAAVTWVLCPGSNRYISGLKPPVELLRKNGLRIRVGTDSLASNETLSLVRELAMLETDAPLGERLSWVSGRKGLVLLTEVDLQSLALTENARTQRIV